ncbi:MAG TPA: hypothetical protein VGY58_04600 [Gemmataceae bacterium]|nr:hypothetical protein [Gemmataceae bacterium]
MTPESVSCPYCNSLVLLTRIPDAEQRIRCPRCQEMFPYHNQGNQPGVARASGDTTEGILVHDVDQAPAPDKRRSNRALARLVIATMAVTASVAVIFALSTTSSRRARDNAPESTAVKIPIVAPAKLAGLSYIPADVDFVAGIHVAELMDQPSTAHILLNLRSQNSYHLQELERSTGLKLEDIDHLVIAANIFRFRPIIVVKTRLRYDKEEVQIALQARPRKEQGQRSVYPFAIKGLAIPWDTASVWFADERTLVFYGFTLNGPNDAPLAPDPSVERLPVSMHEILVGKLNAGTQVWCIGRVEEWEKIRTLLLLARASLPALALLPEKALSVFSGTRAITASIQCNETIARYHFEAGCKDEAAAKKFDDWLSSLAKDWEKQGSLPFLTPQSQEFADELRKTVTHQQKTEWVIVEGTSAIGPRDTSPQRSNSGRISFE